MLAMGADVLTAVAQLFTRILTHRFERVIPHRIVARSATIRFLTASDASRSGASSTPKRPPVHTKAAASSVHPPEKTDTRRNIIFSESVSRSWLQSIIARSVRCRGNSSSRSLGEDLEAPIEATTQFVDGERSHTRRRELKGKCNAIETPADGCDCARIVLGDGEVGPLGAVRDR